MIKISLILILVFVFPATSREFNEPFMDQSTRAQIWCEVLSEDVFLCIPTQQIYLFCFQKKNNCISLQLSCINLNHLTKNLL